MAARISAAYVVACASFLLNMVCLVFIPSTPNHFTWWALALVAFYDVTQIAAGALELIAPGPAAVALKRVSQRVWTVCISCSSIVCLGVLVMSFLACTALPETMTETGVLSYAVGNYAVHFLPIGRLLFTMPKVISHAGYDVGLAAAVVVTYCLYFQPRHIYGCAIPRWFTVIALTLPLLACSLTLFTLYGQRSFPEK